MFRDVFESICINSFQEENKLIKYKFVKKTGIKFANAYILVNLVL